MTIPSPTALSPVRVRFALLALALGGFAIGATEFVVMGLLPNFAADLLPEVYSVSPESANAQAGALISAYALGVVVGAPTIAAAAARWPRKQLLLVLLAAFSLATLASALLPGFGLVLAARFVAGLPHGAYFGIASLVAANLMGPGKRAQGVAIVLSGLTISNVVGVPAITLIGQLTGWRAAYLVVTALFVATFVAVALAVPLQAGDKNATIRNELKAFGRLQVWLALGIGSVGFGGFFAVYSYVAPIVTEVSGLAEYAVPLVLVVVGLGMTVGNIIGGRYADRSVRKTLYVGFVIFIGSMLGIAFTAQYPVWLLIFLFILGGASAALAPTVQTRLMDVASDSQSIAAALNHSALNMGNGLGAALGAVAISAGFGYLATPWIGIVLGLAGLTIAAISFAIDRSRRRRGRIVPYGTQAVGVVTPAP